MFGFIDDSVTRTYDICNAMPYLNHIQATPSSGKCFLMPEVKHPSICVLSKPMPQYGKSLPRNPFTLQLNLYTARAWTPA